MEDVLDSVNNDIGEGEEREQKASVEGVARSVSKVLQI
jgi:hypothetical protein